MGTFRGSKTPFIGLRCELQEDFWAFWTVLEAFVTLEEEYFPEVRTSIGRFKWFGADFRNFFFD